MNILEFAIQRYGPLRETGRVKLGAFNLFAGENEDGKTLTIEAIIKMLFRNKPGKIFPGINRVPENAEGFIVLQTGSDDEIKIPEEASLEQAAGLTPNDFRNLFVIRNSDLSIENEAGFYSDLTERLTGLRTRRIALFRQKLLSLGQLTPNLSIADTQESGKLKSRVNRAETLCSRCSDLLKEASQNAYPELENRFVRLQEEIEQHRRELRAQDNARLRDKYVQGSRLLLTLEEVSENSARLELVTEEDYRAWVYAGKELHSLEHDHAREVNQLQGLKSERAKKAELKKEMTAETETLQQKIARFRQKTDDLITEYSHLTEGLAARKSFKKGLLTAGGVLLLLTIIAFTGLIWRPAPWLPFTTAILIILLLLAFGYSLFRIFLPRAQIIKVEKQIAHLAAFEEITGDGVPEIAATLQRMEDELQKQDRELNEVSIRLDSLDELIQAQEKKRIPEIEEQISAVKKTIRQLKEKHGVNSTEEYQALLSEKKAGDKKLTEAKAALTSLFSSPESGNPVAFWRQQVRELEPYGAIGEEVVFEEQRSENLREKLQELEEELQKCQDAIGGYHQSLKEIEREANKIFASEAETEPLFCQNWEDIERIRQKLELFLDQVKQRRNDIGIAIDILKEIEQEEQEKISALFGADSQAASYFRQFTAGMYTGISYTPEEGIRALHRDGIALRPDQLSGGTYDQLYLAIRLALGEKILGTEKGFFILDDPFLKADAARLAVQLEILQKIASDGWQILYFTAKEEVKSALEKSIASGEITLFSLPSTVLKQPVGKN